MIAQPKGAPLNGQGGQIADIRSIPVIIIRLRD
jgi:hypothetical protein